MDETDLTRVRQAVAGYYRAAGSLGEAALEMRRAALLSEPGPFVESDDVSDREFFLERSAVYTQRALADAGFARLDAYPQLIEELRDSVRFLKMEGAVFAAIANDQLDDGEPDEEDHRA